MRIMIPSSGGVDSSVLLYETLKNTEHDVVSAWHPEDFTPSLQRAAAASAVAWTRVASWLEQEVRPLERVVGQVHAAAPNGDPYDAEAAAPIRPGFTAQRPTYWVRARYATHARTVNSLNPKPDEVWLAIESWNRKHGRPEGTHGPAAYREHTSIPLRTPWIAPDGSGPGRLQILRRLPPGLAPLVLHCLDIQDGAVCMRCAKCLAKQFYNDICHDLTDEQLNKVEKRVERIGGFASGAALADPLAYRYSDAWRALRRYDKAAWRAWAKQEDA